MLNLIGRNREWGRNLKFLVLVSYLGSWSNLTIAPSLVVIGKSYTKSISWFYHLFFQYSSSYETNIGN
jgi:hypothetical protein